ncbi:MAG: carboxymuconolactone decarboxylase family protein [Desulfobacteraceae bacterium]|nr:carboxymuconolactone decarboxylase family protein [Desulfobacteraceae bacterium]
MAAYPEHYNWIRTKFGRVMEVHQQLGRELIEAGPIDEKTGHLIQLAAAAATRSEGAVHSHAKRALEAGASPDEIYHTLVLLISTIGFPTAAAALSWASDLVEESQPAEA